MVVSLQVRYSSVTDSLRLLGCFKGESGRLKVMAVDNTEFAELNKTYLPKYHEAFVWTSEMGYVAAATHQTIDLPW